jgi:hypothetical protein
MPDIRKSFPSKYVKFTDCNESDLILTITRVVDEDMEADGKKESKPVIYFTEVEQGFVCNKSNGEMIASLYGYDTDNWIGKRIALYATKVQFGPKMVDAIRVRERVPAVSHAAAGKGGAAPARPSENAPGQDWKLYSFKCWIAKHPEIAKPDWGTQFTAECRRFFGQEADLATIEPDAWQRFELAGFGDLTAAATEDEIPF